MYLKIHKSGDNTIVALCDKELIGKTLKEGNINVTISEEFYKGELISREEAIDILSTAGNVNIFGEKSVSCAIECGVVDKENVKIINEVAHAQIFRI
ncbi:DUF424 domain-containing protein [Methanolobus bombayensis]|uniref:DUF424 domain-containing protein n=1 Tax=Methanolobus bombayensis TaxID=38023 RepID=UPI001AE500BC|nr:DUF424 family protein [Methanolobus bombayensis]MBP1909902.1 hypothetical protein [Methanolobus bombayensis]